MINASKTKLFVSKNLNASMIQQLQAESGFTVTEDLGVYLDGDETGELEDQVLSLAGRITLAKSVLNSILIYTIASLALPKEVTKDIDKLTCDFIWGSVGEVRKMHLIRREEVSKSKAHGGLGIKFMGDMNLTLIGKLSWQFLTHPGWLWVQVLRSKYIRPTLGFVGNPSIVWHSVQKGVNKVIILRSRWALGNGVTIRF
ncbi:hypothetical protein V2J09_000103 [Rumex salicifolius]